VSLARYNTWPGKSVCVPSARMTLSITTSATQCVPHRTSSAKTVVYETWTSRIVAQADVPLGVRSGIVPQLLVLHADECYRLATLAPPSYLRAWLGELCATIRPVQCYCTPGPAKRNEPPDFSISASAGRSATRTLIHLDSCRGF
jgi:hypothetical protein